MEIFGHELRYKESAFVMITCEEYSETLVEKLQSIPEIKEIQPTCGSYDLIVKIETDSAELLREVICMKIRKMEKIRTTTTLVSSPMIVF